MSSLEIAELTGKLHKEVMRDIRVLLEAVGEHARSFAHTVERPNPSGGCPIQSPCFNLEILGEGAPSFGAIYRDVFGREKPSAR